MTKFSTYRDVLDYMMEKLPMYQRVGAAAYKKDLTNTLALLAATGNPHENLKTIHIAGTNGKGSTSHLIAGGLQASGYSVGLYTSPHYKDFRERIKINGNYISSQYIKTFINTYYDDIERIKPSFFELTVALAFRYFADKKVDYAVIETGLGGRLDSTNVVTPLLSVITNISFDHMNLLGDTLEKIAGEKAGIIKPKIPVLIGERQEDISHVFHQKAEEVEAPMLYADEITDVQKNENGSWDILISRQPWINNLSIDIGGPFQSDNIRTSFAALHLLKSMIPMPVKNWKTFFARFSMQTKFMGRWQILSTKPYILTDSAHNEAGLSLVLEHLKTFPEKNLHFVLGFVNDKDLSKVLNLFPGGASYYFAKANIPRGLPADELKNTAGAAGLQGKSYSSVRKAFATAKRQLQPNDVLFVGGSIFVVAEIL